MEGNRSRRRYKMDLSELHALCSANYVRLLQLFPDYQQTNLRHLRAGESTVTFAVVEQGRYTTTLNVSIQSPSMQECGYAVTQIRLYHDARMAEVVPGRSNKRLESNYAYPNIDMHQPDEKIQRNRHLAELLEFIFSEGRVDRPVFEVSFE